jgi:hypothetical protein
MEAFIIVIAIVLFLIILKNLNDKSARLENRLIEMTHALENLKKKLDEQPREKIVRQFKPETQYDDIKRNEPTVASPLIPVEP